MTILVILLPLNKKNQDSTAILLHKLLHTLRYCISVNEENIPNLKIRGEFEFKYERAFFYEFVVTKVKILYDIQKLEAFSNI